MAHKIRFGGHTRQASNTFVVVVVHGLSDCCESALCLPSFPLPCTANCADVANALLSFAVMAFCGHTLALGANADACFRPELATGILRRALRQLCLGERACVFRNRPPPNWRAGLGYFSDHPCTEEDRRPQHIDIDYVHLPKVLRYIHSLAPAKCLQSYLCTQFEGRVWLKSRAGPRRGSHLNPSVPPFSLLLQNLPPN